jgi:phosphoacetylglucosamine mutase
VADVLAVECALALRQWRVADWAALYADAPSRQDKVRVRDRRAVRTADAERVCVAPAGLQADIDSLVAAAGAGARAFVRPSGTEDVVRVYAEAASQPLADKLAADVAAAVARRVGQ